MTHRCRNRLKVALVAFLALHPLAFTANAQKKVPMPFEFIEDEVLVPIPGEIFAVLDKLGKHNWVLELRVVEYGQGRDRTELALQFGILIAESFIAVQAEDQEKIRTLGSEVLMLSDRLGIKEPVMEHTQSIIDSANANEWKLVKQELDRTSRTVEDVMRRNRDKDLARCVSIGGWLRGTEAVSSLINQDYDKNKAELLTQPDLAAHFIASISKMSKASASNPKIQEIAQGLKKIQASMEQEDSDTIPADKVEEIHAVCQDLIRNVMAPRAIKSN